MIAKLMVRLRFVAYEDDLVRIDISAEVKERALLSIISPDILFTRF